VKHSRRILLALGSTILGGALAVAGESLPLGHSPVGEALPRYGASDFYPSPERPLGWRGDGTGAWPGAKIVTTWDAKSGSNVVWKTPMPAAGLAQPLVVGEKVLTMADPDLLVCVNVHDGKILWQTQIEHTLNLPPQERERARVERQWIIDTRNQYGRWFQRHGALLEKVKAKGMDPKAICTGKGSARHGPGNEPMELGEPVNPELAEAHTQALADPGIKAEYEALRKEFAEQGYRVVWGYSPIIRDDHPTMARAHKAWNDFDLPFSDSWGEPWVTHTFATPCTDGELIYVTTCNNAVAAVDLDGKIRWLVWERIPQLNAFTPTKIGTRFVASPLLRNGKLVVHQNGLLRVYRAGTGEKLWQVYAPGFPGAKGGNQFPWRPMPEACSPAATSLALPDGKMLDIIGTGGPALFRLDDGTMVCTNMPVTGKGHTPFFVDDLYIWKTSADNQPVSRKVFRVKATSRDVVQSQELWDVPRDGGAVGASDAYLNGIIYSGSFRFKASTGEVIFAPKRGEGVPVNEGPSTIVAGDQIVGIWETSAGTQNMAGGPVQRASFLDDRCKSDEAWGGRYLWTFTGPRHFGSPSAQANRLFWRSQGYLWCIGDPKQPFPTPKNCPTQARVSM
jgi:outer membrane protein assembly factor BamB